MHLVQGFGSSSAFPVKPVIVTARNRTQPPEGCVPGQTAECWSSRAPPIRTRQTESNTETVPGGGADSPCEELCRLDRGGKAAYSESLKFPWALSKFLQCGMRAAPAVTAPEPIHPPLGDLRRRSLLPTQRDRHPTSRDSVPAENARNSGLGRLPGARGNTGVPELILSNLLSTRSGEFRMYRDKLGDCVRRQSLLEESVQFIWRYNCSCC